MAIDEIVGDSIDRAVNIEMRLRAGLPRGVTYPLYEAARKKQGKPLTWLAAKLLKDKVKRGDHVFVVTGAGTPSTSRLTGPASPDSRFATTCSTRARRPRRARNRRGPPAYRRETGQ